MNRYSLLVSLLLAVTPVLRSQTPAPPLPAPDPRYKADILLVVGHPDDDIEVAAYLAKAIELQHKRVAVVYMTRGNSGGNANGLEQGKALAEVREVEARKSVGSYGIANVWFLHGSDTPGGDVLHSLEAWGHGQALEQVVRLVRLTRPEVIFTWLPDYVVGENHDDHQAAAVIATEAFDVAANPLIFPEQVEAPRAPLGINNYGEGLRPWQPKKIYFFSDGTHLEFEKGKGPQYPTLDVSPSRKVPYSQIAAEAWSSYKTQNDFTEKELKEYSERPVQLILGKSLIGGAVTGDVFEGITQTPIAYHRARGYEPPTFRLELELGGPWAFYRAFWPAHDLGHIAGLYSPQAQVAPTENLWVPLVLRNDTDSPQLVTLRSTLPAGWSSAPNVTQFTVPSHDAYPVQLILTPATARKGEWYDLAWDAETEGRSVGHVSLHVAIESNGLPQ